MASTSCSSSDCAGCGCATKKGERRDFTRNEAVFNLWKNFAEELKEDLVVPMSLMMCKKCFSAFERYHTLATLIINNMKKALSVLKQDVELPAIKKARLDFDAGRESFPSSSSSLSPGVAVSIFLLYDSTTGY